MTRIVDDFKEIDGVRFVRYHEHDGVKYAEMEMPGIASAVFRFLVDPANVEEGLLDLPPEDRRGQRYHLAIIGETRSGIVPGYTVADRVERAELR